MGTENTPYYIGCSLADNNLTGSAQAICHVSDVTVCGINTSARRFVHTAQLVRGPLSVCARELCTAAAGAAADAVFGGRQVGTTHRSSVGRGHAEAVARYLRRWYYYYYYYNIIISYVLLRPRPVSSVVARYYIRFRCAAATRRWVRAAPPPPVPRAIKLIAIKCCKYHIAVPPGTITMHACCSGPRIQGVSFSKSIFRKTYNHRILIYYELIIWLYSRTVFILVFEIYFQCMHQKNILYSRCFMFTTHMFSIKSNRFRLFFNIV